MNTRLYKKLFNIKKIKFKFKHFEKVKTIFKICLSTILRQCIFFYTFTLFRSVKIALK